jgi:hypothetical protein
VGFVEFTQLCVGGAHADGSQTCQAYRLQAAIRHAPMREKWSGLFVHCMSSQVEERDAWRFRLLDFVKLLCWLGSVLHKGGDELSLGGGQN